MKKQLNLETNGLPFSRRQMLGAAALGAAALGVAGSGEAFASETPEIGGDIAGKVTRLQNAAFAMQDAVPRPLAVGSDIQIGDVISTGKDSRLEFQLLDDSFVRLGERTIFVVTDYVDRKDEENVVLRLLEGAFQAQTGAIGQRNPQAVRVDTPTGSIGIRGTTFWGGPLDGAFEVALLDGAGLFVETRAGRTELTEVGQGTRVEGVDSVPTAASTWAQEKLQRAIATITFDQ